MSLEERAKKYFATGKYSVKEAFDKAALEERMEKEGFPKDMFDFINKMKG